MSYAITLNGDGRVMQAAAPEYAPLDAVLVDTLPDGNIHDYRYVDGAYVHDPEPEQEVIPTPTLGERVAVVEAGQADQAETLNDLVLYLAGEIGGFGAERGPSGALPEGQSDAQNATETSGSPEGRAATIEGGETQ